jgi:hypothetical protein
MVLYIFQIVSECYGWQYARQIVWINFIVNLMTTVICFAFKFIPFSSYNHAGLQSAYVNLMDTMWISAITNCIFIFISDYLCSALMCWSRFQWNGRFILVRILLLHLISEIVLLSDNFISLTYNGYNINEIFTMIGNGFMARTIMSIMLLPFVRILIWYIQHKIEGVVVFDLSAKFNPFKFGINPTDSVQFNADGWDKIDSGKVDVKKMAQYYTKEILEEQHQKQMEEFNNRNHG